MHGHWDIDPGTIGATYIDPKKRKEGGVNIGIAMVTPVEKIVALLHGPTLTADREERMKEIRKKKLDEVPEETLDPTVEDAGERFDRVTSALFQVPKDANARRVPAALFLH